MDAHTRKIAGWVVAAVGVLVAIAGAFADSLGIGAEGAEGMGAKQVAVLVAGLVILVVGLAVALLPLGEKGSTATE